MDSSVFKAGLLKVGLAACAWALASAAALAQGAVTLTARPQSLALPDGRTVPMWGYTCGSVASDGTVSNTPTNASCTAPNGSAQLTSGWQPPVITVPAGSLTITLVNSLRVPTSIVIDGQLGGGLGAAPQRQASPTHGPQGTTWPGAQGGTGPSDTVFTPPAQGQRVRSFATEVAPGASNGALTWPALRKGTYLLHTGTHPSIQHPMGLYAVLVVTDPANLYPYSTLPAGSTAPFDAALPLLLSEIDPAQNAEVNQVVQNAGFSAETAWSGQVGACGDVTKPATAHTCYPPAVNYDPRYFLINGQSFDRGNPAASDLAVGAAAAQGRMLLRLVNAGLRMHIPSAVGLPMTLLAEDGNILPGMVGSRVQNSLFLAPGKTYDVTVAPKAASGAYSAATYPLFDRSLALSTNNQRDGGMQLNLQVAGGGGSVATAAVARADTYYLVAGNVLSVAEAAKGLIANDTGVYGVQLLTAPAGLGSTLTLNPDGTFSYTPGAGITSDSFSYCANGTVSGSSCSSGVTATVTLAACDTASGCKSSSPPSAVADSYASNVASRLQIAPPGVLANDSDPKGLKLSAVLDGSGSCTGNGGVQLGADGSFIAAPATPGTSCSFSYHAVNAQNTASGPVAVSISFASASGLTVTLKDGKSGATLPTNADYRWIIEEDRTVWIDPAIETTSTVSAVRSAAINFHTSHTPVVAQGCTGPISCEAGQTVLNPATGTHDAAVCDVGNGACRPGANKTVTLPGDVHLDPNKRYYLSVLPGDGFITDDAAGGHTMSGAQIAPGQTAVNVFLQATPLEPAKIAVFVFRDDAPLNGEVDTGGGVDVLAPNEPGLGGFNITLLDQAGALGDSAGQLTYDMFGMPVSNSLAGMIDPSTGRDACPISPRSTDGLVGMIVTCPTYEGPLPGDDASTPKVLSPLAGHAVIANMYPGLYEVQVSPSADRIARGEEWLQTNTLDGTKAIEAFIKAGEPAYFQEFGPGGFHVAVGMANPALINSRLPNVCAGPGVSCTGSFYGVVTNTRMSRTPDQRVYSSGSYDSYSFAQCYASLGAPDGDDFAFAKCDENGQFEFTGIPTGNLRVTIFDQWNDLLVDGLSTPIKAVASGPGSSADNRLEIPVTQWRTNLYGRVFIDTSGDGVSQDPAEPGLPLVPFNIRYRDGSYAGFNNTDLAGYAGFNEVFPFLNWLVVDIDSARYKLSGVHVVYDTGGPVDGTSGAGNSTIAAGYANTIESPTAHVPAELRIPGSRYCADADCSGTGSFNPASGNAGSSGRVDPGWASTQGWQGLLGQNSFIEFAMKPFAPTENGGIRGHVIYTSTRPFDDPALLLQLSWEPGVPNVQVNLYKQDSAPDGSKTLTLVDTTATTSWDDWAQGLRRDANGSIVNAAGGGAIPNMSCPGQETNSPFFFTMAGGKLALDPAATPLAYDGRFRCYDGWSMLNQVQPAPYNGMYKFPSVVAKAGATRTLPGSGETTWLQLDAKNYKTNCTICTTGPDGTPMLPPGKYVVEVIVPTGYELVKEEDKNILLGDAFIAPAVQQFAGFGNIFIMPDQAAVNALYNPSNPIQSTSNNGASARREGDTGSVEVFWPCVGATRIVPDWISLFPAAGQQAPFAGASRPLCDRKEVTLNDEMAALVKFYVFSSAHITGHFTGTITNDFASEFDPFSPQFGEKFAVPNTPVAMRDFAGKEIARVYSDQWGIYNGVNFSTFTVNPPSPSGYIPQMMIACMNDPGPVPRKNSLGQYLNAAGTVVASPDLAEQVVDPFYNPAYSNFCYEIPFMPGQTAYLDTPVIPTMGFAAGYNLPDCDYPDTTPAIKSVIGNDATGAVAGSSGKGPWVAAGGAGHTLTISALGDRQVLNHAYSGPMSSSAPFNKKYVTRHYGFGSTQGSVTIGGVAAAVTSWSDSSITATVPATVPLCNANGVPFQRTGTGTATFNTQRCGQLEITAANGKKSIDTVTVSVGGKAPRYVDGTTPSVSSFGHIQPSPLQTAIDQAAPGDLILIGPGTYKENLLMWKPVRLQGVGAESVFVNADAHPAGKMDAWRRQVNCLFGLALNGQPNTDSNPFDPSNTYSCAASMRQHVDRIPFEAILGWDVTGNGNLAQMLQEPTLMGAYEGAGVTVLAKGVWMSAGTSVADQFGAAAAGGFPADFRYLNNSTTNNDNGDCRIPPAAQPFWREYYSSNFLCNPSGIDGLSVLNSSQGGGAIFAHAWNHNLQVGNTRVHGNHGTLTGGITIGNGEFPDPIVAGADVAPPFPVAPQPAGYQYGYGYNRNTNVHHNAVTANASIGDALYSGTPSAAGGVTFCTGADSYKFNNNWICGNLSSGDAGGVAHTGFINDGNISHNWILFNQSQSPTIPVNGGGLGVLGASPDRTITTGPNAGQECGAVTDQDCPPGLPEGTGRNLVIDANLIVGNSAESGTGGGVRLQMVNGQDVVNLPLRPDLWNSVTLTNNIIANNVAGWDGGGISMQDALKVKVINNTVIDNDTTASAGVLFNTLGAPLAAVPPPGCTPTTDPTQPQNPNCINPVTTSTNQAAGLVTMQNTPNLRAEMPANVLCPVGNSSGLLGATLPVPNGDCRSVSFPQLLNNVLWHNRAFHVEVGALGTGPQEQQRVVTLVPALNQTSTGFCATQGTDVGAPGSAGPVSYWDIGVRGDTAPANHGSGFTLQPFFSILSSGGYAGTNLGSDPAVVAQYCNGARIPPENCTGVSAIDNPRCKGYNAPAGHSEFTGLPVVFALNQTVVAATVDEGNNWIDLGYGPLSLSNPSGYTAPGGSLTPLLDAHLNGGSPAINAVSTATVGGALAYAAAPQLDFFGTNRKSNNSVDIGAVEFVAASTPAAAITGGPLAFGNVFVGANSAPQTLTLSNTGTGAVTGIALSFAGTGYARSTSAPGSCPTTATFTLNTAASCAINVVFHPTALGLVNGTLTVNASVPVTGSPVGLSGTGVAPPAQPVLAVLDNFNRANATTLGANWQQAVTLGSAAIQVNTNQAFCATPLACALGGWAYWNGTGASFGAQQAAAFTYANATVNNTDLFLKVTGSFAAGLYPNGVGVNYNAGTVTVSTYSGLTQTVVGTLATTLVNGATLTALADANGWVHVWNNTTYVGAVQTSATGSGRIGMHLPSGARTDNFAGGTVP